MDACATLPSFQREFARERRSVTPQRNRLYERYSKRLGPASHEDSIRPALREWFQKSIGVCVAAERLRSFQDREIRSRVLERLRTSSQK